MRKSSLLVLLCMLAAAPAVAQTSGSAPAASAVAATKGQMLHDANGGRLAPVDQVTSDGSVQIIFYGKVVTVPASTLSVVDGDLKTSLTKNQVLAIH